jgi:uncharacterized protein
MGRELRRKLPRPGRKNVTHFRTVTVDFSGLTGFYLCAIPAVILLGLSKGGFQGVSLLSLPLMALVVSPIEALAIMLPILMIQDVVSAWAYCLSWDGRLLLISLPSAAIGIGLGYLLAAQVSDAGIALLVGVIACFFGVRQLWGRVSPPRRVPTEPGIVRGIGWGIATGFTSMIAQAGVPTMQIFLLPYRLSRDVFVGTLVMQFLVVNWMRLPAFLALGRMTVENLILSASLLPIAIASTWLGVHLVRRTPGPRFFLLMYVLLVLVGARLIWNGWTAL